MNNWFRKNMKTKIISVLVAFIFWLYVANISNPFTTKIIYNVPVKIENESYLKENGYTINNTVGNSIDITIRGRKDAVDKIRTSDFETSVDFSQIQSVNDNKLIISEPVCTQKDVTIDSYSPTVINVQLTRNKSGTFNVELEKNITMKPGYVLLKTTMSPESLPIYGEEFTIDSVGSIKAVLEVKDLDRDTSKVVQCKAYNKDGKELSGLSNDLKVTVKLEVAKEVPISLVTSGRLADDYVETLRIIEPVKALITGKVETLADISSIKTEPVEIDTIAGNFTASVPLVVPEGVKLVNTPNEITVNINVEKLVLREINLIKDDISILNAVNDGSLQYEIKTDAMMLQFKGRQADVNAIKIDNLKPAVDVAGLAEGTHRLLLNISASTQVKLMQKIYVEVVISKTVEPSDPVT